MVQERCQFTSAFSSEFYIKMLLLLESLCHRQFLYGRTESDMYEMKNRRHPSDRTKSAHTVLAIYFQLFLMNYFSIHNANASFTHSSSLQIHTISNIYFLPAWYVYEAFPLNSNIKSDIGKQGLFQMPILMVIFLPSEN